MNVLIEINQDCCCDFDVLSSPKPVIQETVLKAL